MACGDTPKAVETVESKPKPFAIDTYLRTTTARFDNSGYYRPVESLVRVKDVKERDGVTHYYVSTDMCTGRSFMWVRAEEVRANAW